MRRSVFAVIVCLGLAVCGPAWSSDDDPFEPFNRVMYDFNYGLMNDVILPFGTFWERRLPDRVVHGLGNVYNNLIEIEFVLNNILVGDARGVGISVSRFILNSTVGLFGFFEVADSLGLYRVKRDFGASLCAAGLPAGPYLVLPLIGATNTVAAPTLVLGIALEVYLLSLISTTLAAIDLIIIDIGGSASALRYATSFPDAGGADPYVLLREDYLAYIREACEPVQDQGIMTAEQPGIQPVSVPVPARQ